MLAAVFELLRGGSSQESVWRERGEESTESGYGWEVALTVGVVVAPVVAEGGGGSMGFPVRKRKQGEKMGFYKTRPGSLVWSGAVVHLLLLFYLFISIYE